MMNVVNSVLDKPRLDNLTNEIWKSAERLRGKFTSGKKPVHSNAPFLHRLSPLENHRCKTGFCQKQTGKKTGRAASDDDRPVRQRLSPAFRNRVR